MKTKLFLRFALVLLFNLYFFYDQRHFTFCIPPSYFGDLFANAHDASPKFHELIFGILESIFHSLVKSINKKISFTNEFFHVTYRPKSDRILGLYQIFSLEKKIVLHSAMRELRESFVTVSILDEVVRVLKFYILFLLGNPLIVKQENAVGWFTS